MLLNIKDDNMFSTTIYRNRDSHGDDTIGIEPNFIIRYMDRPAEYEHISLLDMARKYYFSKNAWHKSKRESLFEYILKLMVQHLQKMLKLMNCIINNKFYFIINTAT